MFSECVEAAVVHLVDAGTVRDLFESEPLQGGRLSSNLMPKSLVAGLAVLRDGHYRVTANWDPIQRQIQAGLEAVRLLVLPDDDVYVALSVLAEMASFPGQPGWERRARWAVPWCREHLAGCTDTLLSVAVGRDRTTIWRLRRELTPEAEGLLESGQSLWRISDIPRTQLDALGGMLVDGASQRNVRAQVATRQAEVAPQSILMSSIQRLDAAHLFARSVYRDPQQSIETMRAIVASWDDAHR